MASLEALIGKRTRAWAKHAEKPLGKMKGEDLREVEGYLAVMANKIPAHHVQGDLMVTFWLIGQIAKLQLQLDEVKNGSK